MDKIRGGITCFISSYGVKPFRPLYLFLILVIVGAIINYRAYDLTYDLPDSRLRKGRTMMVDFFVCYLLRPFFYSFRNSIPLPEFLSFTKKAKQPEHLIYILYAQKILALLLLASALGYLAI